MRFVLLPLLFTLLHAQENNKEENKDDFPSVVSKQDAVTIAGKKIDYKVTASTLSLKTAKDEDRASIFHVAYERIGMSDRHKRPIVFAFNGGPGSSAVWLHMGALGPRIVPTTPDGTKTLPPPLIIKENPQSILDVADIVFIDPVSTGFSRAEGKTKAAEFHGVNGDIRSVGDFIRRWVTENDRWASPKYLLGESYGGIRAAGLADHLQDEFGMSLNGVVLLSSLIDFRTLRSNVADDLSYSVFFPGLTATSHYHQKIQGNRNELVEQARAFAFGTYSQALLKGAAISAKEKKSVADQMAKFTGLPASLFVETNLRLSSTRFRKELLRDESKVLGRFDARIAWPSTSPESDYASYDPSYSVAYGAFSTAINDYLSRDLGWEGHHPYKILTSDVRPWDWGTSNSVVNMARNLESAMRENPDLRILVMCGYTDLATPPANMQYSIDHLFNIPNERRKAIKFTWYEAGHMFYLNQPDLEKMRTDLVDFIK
ncbi:MAG: peptidase S10 [Akkermansiaceae bacterium]|jgi:carboxypeptidase C (cathepsin A)|nr:peptidase S10 [Akkermansiaceae bacterium]